METASKPAVTLTGGCLCGAVRYRVHGPMRDVVNCHCEQCLRTHGHVAAYSSAQLSDVVLTEDRGLKWFRSSTFARRGFCGECGSSLFWERDGTEAISIAAGTVDRPTGLNTIMHIFVEHASDYYMIVDDLEKRPRGLDPNVA